MGYNGAYLILISILVKKYKYYGAMNTMTLESKYRYKCIDRITKEKITGDCNNSNKYLYKILDAKTGKTTILDRNTVKKELSNGVIIDGLKLSSNNRLLFKPFIENGTRQKVDFSLAANSFYEAHKYDSIFTGCKTLRIRSCGYNTIERVAKKALMIGGLVHNYDKYKIVFFKSSDTLNMLAEQWVYSENQSHNYPWNMSKTFGGFASILKIREILLDGIEFTTNNISEAFVPMTTLDDSPAGFTSIKIINSDMSIIRNMDKLCKGNDVLQKFEILDTRLDNVCTMKGAFSHDPDFSNKLPYIEKLEINIPKPKKLIDIDYLFSGYSGNNQPDLEFLSDTKIKSANEMFSFCIQLRSIDLSDLDFSNCTNTHAMFECCDHLKTINFGNKKAFEIVTARRMFQNCSLLEHLDLSNVNISKCTIASSMFKECHNLKTIDFGDQTFRKLKTIKGMFENCKSLEELDLTVIKSPILMMSKEKYLDSPQCWDKGDNYRNESLRNRTKKALKGINRKVKLRIPKKLYSTIIEEDAVTEKLFKRLSVELV